MTKQSNKVSGRTFSKIVDRYLNFHSHVVIENMWMWILKVLRSILFWHVVIMWSDFKSFGLETVEGINCKDHNERTGAKVSTSHICGYTDCYVQTEMIKRQKMKIDYNSTASNEQ